MDHHLELIVNGLRQLLSSDTSAATIATSNTANVDASIGKLRFVRDKGLGGSLFAFCIELDGHPIGQLRPGETLECSASVGIHKLKIGHRGALFDASMEISVAAGQTHEWEVSLGWTGTVKLSERWGIA